MAERGQIEFRERSLQVKDYSHFRYGKVTPTDIDGAFELRDRCFVFLELKKVNAPFHDGQRLFFERVCNVINKSVNRECLVLICIHNTDVNSDIMVDQCKVWKYLWRDGWKDGNGRTAKEYCDSFIDYIFNIKGKKP